MVDADSDSEEPKLSCSDGGRWRGGEGNLDERT
jgi:hypothetical protein